MHLSVEIKGQTPAQKNAKKIAGRGGRAMLYTEKRVTDWQDSASIQLSACKVKFEGKVEINYRFNVGDNSRRDIDKMIASVNDALVKAGIIVDDDWKHLTIGMADARVDKENPSAYLFIRSVDE